MIIHNYKQIPVRFEYEGYEISELNEFSIDVLEEKGVEEIWYWYVEASYAGAGWMIARIGEKWFAHQLSHCSCYGPIDDFMAEGAYHANLDALEAGVSEECRRLLEPLIEMARKKVDSGRRRA